MNLRIHLSSYPSINLSLFSILSNLIQPNLTQPIYLSIYLSIYSTDSIRFILVISNVLCCVQNNRWVTIIAWDSGCLLESGQKPWKICRPKRSNVLMSLASRRLKQDSFSAGSGMVGIETQVALGWHLNSWPMLVDLSTLKTWLQLFSPNGCYLPSKSFQSYDSFECTRATSVIPKAAGFIQIVASDVSRPWALEIERPPKKKTETRPKGQYVEQRKACVYVVAVGSTPLCV